LIPKKALPSSRPAQTLKRIMGVDSKIRYAAQFALIEFFHWLAIALNRRRHERVQRIDNNGHRRMSATMIEHARFKTPSWPLVS